MGVNHSTKGTETVNAINNLALITGNIGRAGASPFSITGQCNAMGTREAGFASGLPGYRSFDSAEHRHELARIWNVDADRIPSRRGLAYPDIIEAAVAGKIRALWIIGTNPLVSFPNIDVLKQALENLDFLVVQDGFHPTPTTELADLVLPAAIWGEKEGTYTNSERRVSKVNAAVDPPGEARSDFEIFLALARTTWLPRRIVSRLEQSIGCIRRVAPRIGGTAVRLLRNDVRNHRKHRRHAMAISPRHPRRSSFRAPPLQQRRFPDQRWPCAPYSHAVGALPEQPNAEFPFVLNTGRTVEHWHTRTKTGAISILQEMSPRAWLEMNPADAHRLNLKPHDRVDVVSARGRVSRVELRVTEIIAAGQVFLPFHFVETNANQITQSAFDPISREPNFKQCAVRVEKSANTAH